MTMVISVSCMIVMFVIVRRMIVLRFLLGFEHRCEPVQTQPFVERESNQLGLVLRKFGEIVDLSEHSFYTSARGLSGHRERVGK